MKRPCFGYFFNKYCCSLVSYRPLPNAKPGKKAGKNKLVLSSAIAIYKLQTPFTALVQKPETRKMNEFLKETIFFFIFCFSFLLFVFKFRATGVLCFPNNRKYKSDRMLNFSLMRSAFARKASCCSWRFAILEKFLP